MMCFGAIMNYNIGRVCYALESLGDGVVYHRKETGRHQASYRPPTRAFPALRADSAQLFREFAARNHAGQWAVAWAADLAHQVIATTNERATFRLSSEGQCSTDLLAELNSEQTGNDPGAFYCRVCRTADQHRIEVCAGNNHDAALDESPKNPPTSPTTR
jgi:hypothetical protein